MDKEQIRILLDKYRTGKLTEEERSFLESWYLTKASDQQATLDDDELQANLQIVKKVIMSQTRPHRLPLKQLLSAAAAILVVASAAIWYFTINTPIAHHELKAVHQHDVLPGGNKATLTLANGQIIDLSKDQHGIVIGAEDITYEDGTAIWDVLGGSQDEVSNGVRESQQQMALVTPRGGQYQLTLPDGTNVWLNAASTLRYPRRFDSHKREVELEGEAYFEVRSLQSASGDRLPFVVKSRGQEINVLGTAFNVSAYADEAFVKTTLVNGRVRVVANQLLKEVLLAPGQETLLSETAIETRQADVASAIAWKSGKFRFNELELRAAMNQLSRWYDLEIEYQGTIPETYFYGVINRNRTLAAVLDLLAEGGVNFKVDKTGETNKLIVLP